MKIEVPVSGENISQFSFEVQKSCPDYSVSWISSWFVDHIHKGSIVKNGQIFTFGWGLLQAMVEGEHLILRGPDFKSMPIEWCDDITPVCKLLVEHKFVPLSYGFEMDIPSIRDTAIVGWEFEKLPMMMSRREKSKDNRQESGWLFGSIKKENNKELSAFIQLMSLYEAGLKAPFILRYLSMPMDTQILFKDRVPLVFFKENQKYPKPGSYLAEKLKKEKLS